MISTLQTIAQTLFNTVLDVLAQKCAASDTEFSSLFSEVREMATALGFKVSIHRLVKRSIFRSKIRKVVEREHQLSKNQMLSDIAHQPPCKVDINRTVSLSERQ